MTFVAGQKKEMMNPLRTARHSKLAVQNLKTLDKRIVYEWTHTQSQTMSEIQPFGSLQTAD
jgi:hypothetical protein